MFENTLLIIKSDYMSRRKCLLLHLLSKGFQIQGNRKLAFTPEDAAEFYKELADDKCYMLYVILLSKGTSEAFILRKENSVEELLNTMICYFGTSVEMDRNIHVSRSNDDARREITFIFPNYIHEPLPFFDKNSFCQQPIMAPLLGEVYEIMQAPNPDPEMNWRTKLSNWLIRTNASLPEVSNQCSLRPQIGFMEKHQQTEPVQFKDDKPTVLLSARSSLKSSSRDSTGLLTSTSCVSCSSFGREEQKPCPLPAHLAEFEARLSVRATKTLEEPCEKTEDEKVICDEHVDWINIYEYEDYGEGEEETAEFEGVVEVEDNVGDAALETAEPLSTASGEYKDVDATLPIDEQGDGENVPTETMDELQVEEPTEAAEPAEPAPPAEGEIIEEKANNEAETEQATELEPAPPTEPVNEETAEADEPAKTEDAPEA